MRIDTHAHLWPAEYLDLLDQSGGGGTGTAIARGMGASASEADLRERFRMMDEAGVQKQVLSATPQLLQSQDEALAVGAARMINDYYAELIGRYPDRFLAYGAVPLPHAAASAAEARRIIEELGLSGVAINTLVGTGSIADPAYDDFYAELDRLGAILYIHPTGCGALSPMINDFNLHWVIGAPYEDTIAALQLVKADIPHRFPNIRFHVAHLGGNFAFSMQRIEDTFEKWKAFPRSPREQLSRMWFDTANFHKPALRCMVDTVGHERLLLGTDFPYIKNEDYVRAVEYVKGSGLAEEVVSAILEGNALRMLAAR